MIKVPKTVYPTNIELDYYSDIKDLHEELTDSVLIFLMALSKDGNKAKEKTREIDLISVPLLILNNQFDQFRNKWNAQIDSYNFSSTSNQLVNFSKNNFQRQLKAVNRNKNLSVNNVKPTLDKKLNEQKQAFITESKIKLKGTGNALIDKIQVAVIDAVKNNKTLNLELIDSIIQKSINNIAFNIRDVFGKALGSITKDIHKENDIFEFEWTSMRDNRVRPLHQDLDGRIFSYANLPDEGLPGEPPNCRCVETPVFRLNNEIN